MCCSLPPLAPSSSPSAFAQSAKPLTSPSKRAWTFALEGLLEPVFQESYLGRAEVRNTFRVTGAGTIAGCYVTDGVLNRTAQIRVVRDGVVINTSKLSSLKRFKDDASEVRTGFECGVGISNFNDVKIGDILEAFSIQKVSGAEAAAAQSGASARR